MKYLIYISIYLTIGVIIYFNACKTSTDDTISPNTTNTGCGPRHYPAWTSFQYIQYYSDGTTSKYRCSFLGLTETVENICTKTEPRASGYGSWSFHGIYRQFTVIMKVYTGCFVEPYSQTAAVTYTSDGGQWDWNGFNCGLVQCYQGGPGKFTGIDVEVSFPYRGSQADDSFYFYNSNFIATGNLSY